MFMQCWDLFLKCFFIGLIVANAILLKYVSMSDQECKVTPAIVNINSNELLFYPYSIPVNKFSGSCNDIYNPYAKLWVPDVVKNMNINETRYVSWHVNID